MPYYKLVTNCDFRDPTIGEANNENNWGDGAQVAIWVSFAVCLVASGAYIASRS
jgi:hypothetical protein